MSESEWLTCPEPSALIALVRERLSERKQRLCALALARAVVGRGGDRHRRWFDAPRWLEQIAAAERYADGLIGAEQARKTRNSSGGPHNFFLGATKITSFSLTGFLRSLGALRSEFGLPDDAEACEVVRDLFDPFWRERIEPTWRGWGDGVVVRLAQGIYDGREFDQLPILGDALEDAGCDDRRVLDHCRRPGRHVRGCWVLDAVLMKERR
jgi:hypothetical protein